MKIGLTPKKSLGQHWLNDPASLEAVIQAAELKPPDLVVEVGPGLGSLTKLLVNQVSTVIAIEIDKRLIEKLKQSIKADNLKLIQADILRFDLNSLPKDYKLVANLPYYLTGNLIRRISQSANPPQSCSLLVQKEVAQRLAAKPGQMSLLSITAQFYWQVKLGRVVQASLFTPPPKVDSQIVSLMRMDGGLYSDVEPEAFFNLAKLAFNSKRKTLVNSLSRGLKLDKQVIERALTDASIDPKRRPQSLSLEDWHKLYLSPNLTR